MKLEKKGRLAFKNTAFYCTVSMGIGRGGLRKAMPFPVIVFLVIKCFVCRILRCLISGFFFFFLLAFLDFFPKKKRPLDELLLVASKCVWICGLWWMKKGGGRTVVP